VGVVLVALTAGTIPALITAVGAFVVYDFLFVDPLHTLMVEDPGEWLTLLLLLFVGLVVGRLTGVQRERATSAVRREQEARALFGISRTLALSPSALEALPDVVATVIAETRFDRVAISLVGHDGTERTVVDSVPDATPAEHSHVVEVLHRRPGTQPAEWRRVNYTTGRPSEHHGARSSEVVYRVFIESAGHRLGSVWAFRGRQVPHPSREETRIVSAAADQVGQAVERDRLAGEAMRAEVARRGDAAKTALLDSVSHDLRTPLAAIRAAAGNLMDPAISWSPDVVRQGAATIDAEAERLTRIVSDLLDLSRIEAGALRPETRPFVTADLVARVVGRLRVAPGAAPVEIDIAEDLPPILVDEVLFEQVLVNLLENAERHAPGAHVRVRAGLVEDGAAVRIVVDDNGQGVPDESMERLFEKFYRVPKPREGSRRGSGIGLAVVRGMVEAMNGRVRAEHSERGGLAIAVDLPVAVGAPPTGPVAIATT
jgi:two-component system sensor histidine kinase KdpD